MDSGSLFHHFLATEEYAIFGQLLAFLCFLNSHAINSRFVPQALLGEITYADEVIHPQFGTDTTDIWMQINPKVRIRIPDHFSFKFWRWRRFALFITERTSDLTYFQNAVASKGYTNMFYRKSYQDMCYLEVSF